jgi:branched-chain amino acid transport system permease protein
MDLFWQDLVNGLLAGGIFAVVALGFSLVWGIMNIINLAHGAFVMLGAYTAFVLFSAWNIDPFISVPIAFVVLFVLGYALQRFVLNFVVRAPILTTYSGANFALGPVTIAWTKLLTLVAALIITALMQLFLTKTKTGRAIRATSMDIGAAQLSGVRVAHLYAIVFGLGAGLAGAAGALISLSYSLQPSMGDPFIITAFVVCVLGGLGSVSGALVGGLVYGVLESFGSQYVGTGVQDAVALVVLLIVLIVRPTGIMGRASA